jgi:Ser/Thr protein kinase RdoA (MazF antagonist)/cyclopropane fatty-acyl-phospholipid synthase-like methyltransferase/ribosomal protein S18 acetylase RimI-like enzyme
MLDKTLPYYNIIMKRLRGMPVPPPSLPEGYRFGSFEEGDAEVWAEILVSVGEFDDTGEALSCFCGDYLSEPEALRQRLLFVQTDAGEKVGTLINWWNDTNGRRDPSVHWVAVKPEHQGVGVGKALVYEGLRRMIGLEGERDFFLHTQTWSCQAISLYLHAGYRFVREETFGGYQNDYDQAMPIIQDKLAAYAIRRDIIRCHGLSVERMVSLPGGWLNRLWKLTTNRGELLVKQFSHERYDAKKLQDIEAALQRQILVTGLGVPAPAIWPVDGTCLRHVGEHITYMLMAYNQGQNLDAGQINLEQMRDVGHVLARIHHAFAMLPPENVTGWPLEGKARYERLIDTCQAQMEQAHLHADAYRAALQSVAKVLPLLDETLYDRVPKGIAHEDYSSDNILFHSDRVAAVIDFDRNQYSYLWHDVGRCLLSFAWNEGAMNWEAVRAFCDGYQGLLPLSLRDVADAFRITWCLEVFWWIQPDMFSSERGKATRFRDEILWLTNHWEELAFMCDERTGKRMDPPAHWRDIDNGKAFEWGRTSQDYGKYRDIYPDSFYRKLLSMGIGLKGQDILDLGTGTGVLPRGLYPHGARFVGTDRSAEQIEVAKALAKEQGMEIAFHARPAEDTGMPDGAFDVITACQCFLYFDKSIVLSEIRRMLRAGGMFATMWMAWVPGEDAVSSLSEAIILRYNPDWKGSGYTRMQVDAKAWEQDGFRVKQVISYDEKIPFQLDNWVGRIRACRGIGASLPEEKIKAFDVEHRAAIRKAFGESFEVLHHILLASFEPV